MINFEYIYICKGFFKNNNNIINDHSVIKKKVAINCRFG